MRMRIPFLLIGSLLFGAPLMTHAAASDGEILSWQKISDTEGGLVAVLEDNDQIGYSLTNIGDLNDDGIPDLAVGVFGDDDGGDGRGAVYILFMNADGTVASEQKVSDTEGGFTGVLEDGDRFGSSVAGIGDLDSDGIPDLAVGVLGDDDGGADRGAIYVLFMNADGTVASEQKISDTTGGLAAVLDNSDQFGFSLAGIGDLNDDDLPDLVVGVQGDDDGGTGRGAVYVLFMNANGTVASEQKISDTTGGLAAVLEDNDVFGYSVAGIGDLNDDGMPDIVVGAYSDDDGGNARGAVYVLFMNTNGTVASEQKISDTEGGLTSDLGDGDLFGSSVLGLGDLDNDGVLDLVVGAFGDDDGGNNRGAMYILFMNADGTVASEQKISDTEGGFTGVLDDGDVFGYSLAALGDLNDDGVLDLAAGAYSDDDGGGNRGAVYVITFEARQFASRSDEAISTPTNLSFDISSSEACSVPHVLQLNVSAQNTQRVVLATNPDFLDAVTYAFSPNTSTTVMTIPRVVTETGDHTFYLFFESSDSNRSNIFSEKITIDLADCGEQDVEEDIAIDENQLLTLPSTGTSPVNGTTESISEVRIGDLIRGSSYDAVYYIESDGTRRPFLNEAIFFTHFSDFAKVKEVTDATLGVIRMGSPMLPKAGVVLMKIQSDPNVYAIESHPTNITKAIKRHIPNEQVAKLLYGDDWSEYVIDLDAILYGRFVDGNDMEDDSAIDTSSMQRRND